MTFKHERRIPPVLWAVVADRSQARVLSAPWPRADSWEEVAELVCADGALAPHEAYTDGPGTFADVAGGHHAGEDQTDFRHQTAGRFAGEIVDVLEKGRANGEFGRLLLVAPPLFLGVLRKKLPAPLSNMVILELDKDYSQAKPEEIRRRLQGELAAHAGSIKA
ncbi:MAG: host attachment protein [Planctomycetaceae bacterium]